jgi:acyl-homoserine lactone synthase
MLSDLFSHLCPGGVPDGDDCWEISRLLATPVDEGEGTAVLRIYRLLALALVEFAAAAGIRRYTLVADAARVPVLLSVGWRVVPLGLPTASNGESLQALQIELDAETLRTMQRRLRRAHPVLRVPHVLGKAA